MKIATAADDETSVQGGVLSARKRIGTCEPIALLLSIRMCFATQDIFKLPSGKDFSTNQVSGLFF